VKALIWSILGIIVFLVTLVPVMVLGAAVSAYGTAVRIYNNVRDEIITDRIINRIHDQDLDDLRSLH
jgi:hypothetical protein